MPATQISIGQQLSQYLQCMFESESKNAIKSYEFFIEKTKRIALEESYGKQDVEIGWRVYGAHYDSEYKELHQIN